MLTGFKSNKVTRVIRIVISSLKSNHVYILVFICFVFIHYLTYYFHANSVLIVIVKALSNLL